MLYTVITNDRPVATTDDEDVVDRLNGDDPILRDTVRCLKRAGQPLWDGISDFSSRPATETEQAAFHQWQTAGLTC